MPGTSSAKTRFALLPGHDELLHRAPFYWPHFESDSEEHRQRVARMRAR
jgi:hypothetical protein